VSTIQATEAVSEAHRNLDQLSPRDLLAALVEDQETAVRAVRAALPQLEGAVNAAVERLERGGRLVYAGAGTSGRLGVLDATELHPTFSWPTERAVALIAGGATAITQAVEGAEDDAAAGAADVRAVGVGADDVLIAIAASGTTTYALAAVAEARRLGAVTVTIANNPGAPLLSAGDYPVLLDTGPEVISGSTRLKAGTSQKIALNAFSSAVMVRLGKVYGNLMVDLRATNAKLRGRAIRLTVLATGASEEKAAAALREADWSVKAAIVMLRLGVSGDEARTRLESARGWTRRALGEA
jgi:N-acetylmuramic acid 6-phosphate etherase